MAAFRRSFVLACFIDPRGFAVGLGGGQEYKGESLLLNGMQWVGGSGERHHADAQHFSRTACLSYLAYAHGSRHSQRVPVSRA